MSNIIKFREKGKKKVEGQRSFEELYAMAIDKDGIVDPMLIENVKPVGYNHGTWCDVTSGPCRCGAWH